MNRLFPPDEAPPWDMAHRRRGHIEACRTGRSRRQAVGDALQGLCDAWRTQPNLRLHVVAGFCVIGFGVCIRLSLIEWLWVSFAIGLVIFAELMNTAIEQTVDLIVGLRPDPLARRIKDVAAGCVLVATLLSIAIQTLTFIPHLLTGL